MYTTKTADDILKRKRNMKGWNMDNGDQIQQTNLVSDDTAAAMNDGGSSVQTDARPALVQPQADPIPAGSAADPIAPPVVPDINPSAEPVDTPAAMPPPIETDPVIPDVAPSAAPVIEETPASSDSNYAELDDIKRSALDELKPLIEHVEQVPEERFETIMMMIRSNDDPKLIPTAYEAAKSIENEKIRASALLNIVSEIEYLKSKA